MYLLLSFGNAPKAEAGLFVIDSNEKQVKLPLRFKDPADFLNAENIDRTDLSNMQISGSGQFSPSELDALIDKLGQDNLIIIDLREESHGFINDMAVSWYAKGNAGNKGKSLSEIQNEELASLHGLQQKKSVSANYIIEKEEGIIQKIMPVPIFISSAYTEDALCQRKNISYFRLPITDHCRPADDQVDAFIHLIKTKGKTSKFHVHCRGGKGRTATIFMMYDMLLNADKLSMEAIADRQKKITDYDLFYILPKEHWKYRTRLERVEFLKNFYLFCKENLSKKNISWSSWIKKRNSS
ncbi:MAG: hypothetical protein Tsb0015_16030 [Simkaniaceae bacterium]